MIVQFPENQAVRAVPNRPFNWLKRAFVKKMVSIAERIPQTQTLANIESVRVDIPHLEEAADHIDLLTDSELP